MNRLHKIKDFLGLQRNLVGLLSMVLLVEMGERMAERFLPLYLIALGGGALSVGALNGLDNLLSALYSFPGGYLSDRFGTKKALLIFNIAAAFGYIIVILIPSWPAVIVGSIFFLSWSAISLPATMDLIGTALPEKKRTMGVSLHSLVRRAPMAIGPVLGGLSISIWGIQTGIRVAFLVALATAIMAAIIQQILIDDTASDNRTGRSSAEKNPLRVYRNMSSQLKSLLVSDILIRFCEQIPYAFVVIWCTREIASPVSELQFGFLTAIEMATAVLVYIPVAYFADKSSKKPFVLLTFLFFTLFPLVLLFSTSFPLLVGAFILRGLKEFGEPTRKSLILDLSPADRRASMFGLYYLLRDTVVSVAAFGGAFLWQMSPGTNFLVAFGFGLLGSLWFAARGKDFSKLS